MLKEMMKISLSRHCSILILFLCVSSTVADAQQKKVTQQSAINDPIFKLDFPLKFKPNITRSSIRKSEIDKLLTKKIEMNGGDGLELATKTGGKVKVFTCREYTKELSKGSYALTTYDMTMQSYPILTCDLL